MTADGNGTGRHRQSPALAEETGTMRAIEAALGRAKALPDKARGRVLRWAKEVAEEALLDHQAEGLEEASTA